MKRYLLLLLILVSFTSLGFSQKLQVETFKLAESDLSAQTQPRKDLNDRNCALVKVQFVGTISEAEGNVVMPLVKRGNETWIYMPQGSKQLKLLTQSYLPIMITFSDYGIEKLESNRTYVLPLIKPNGYSESVDAGGNFYVLNIQPKNAVVFIDGTLQASSSDGEYSAMLPYGTHTYKVEAGGYISKSGSFIVSSGEMSPINVNLASAMASITVTCPTPAVSVYVDKKFVDSVPWTGSIKDGMHLIEVRKDGYRSQQRTIQLSQQQKMDVAFDELAAILGNLSVNYKPFGADVYVDGKKLGQSPRVFNGLLVGHHQVEVRKDGYTTDRKTVTISDGQTASVVGTLVANTTSLSNNSSPLVYSSGNTLTIPVKDGISIDMVKVEAGIFMMGATPEMENPWVSEKPVHKVTLTQNFYIGKYEVTQALWQAIMGNNPSYFKGDGLPVEKVSWNDCQKFIDKLNKATGRKFRLPTEAEWEYAARGGAMSRGYQYSGSNSLEDVAWYGGNSSNMTHVVGTKRANELGLYDMSGNVWEWCQDWNSAYSSSPKTNPIGALKGRSHMSRGGSWYDEMMDCRSSNRISYDPDYRYYCLGLRLTLSEDNVMEMDLEEARKRLRAIEKAANEGIKDSAPTFGLN